MSARRQRHLGLTGSLDKKGDDRDGLRRERDQKHDPRDRYRVGRRAHQEDDLRHHRERKDKADPHLAASDEVADPEIEEGVRQRGNAIDRSDGHGRGVLAADDETDEKPGGNEVGERRDAARCQNEAEGKEQCALRRLAPRMRARRAFEEQGSRGSFVQSLQNQAEVMLGVTF